MPALPAIGFVAPLIRAATVSLQAQLDDQIAQFNAEAANTVDLAVPATYHFGANDTLSAYSFPQVEVAVVEGSMGGWSVGQVDVDHDLTLTVVVWDEAPTGQVPEAVERAYGYIRCVIETLRVPGAIGDAVLSTEPGGVYWRCDVLPADPDADDRSFRKWRIPAFVQLRLETVERFA